MSFESTHAALQDELGMQALVHAVDLDTGAEVGAGADVPVVAASVFKLPVLVEFQRQVAAGELDPTRAVDLPAGHTPTAGPTGLSVVDDAVRMSLRDLVLAMMSVSDNRATDVVLGVVGLDRVNALLSGLGLPGTVLVSDCAGLFRDLLEDLGLDPRGPLPDLPPFGARLLATRPLDPARTTRTTPRETTALLLAVWLADGLPEAACAAARAVLARQVWPHRMRSGFPDEVRVSGKTGTFGHVRNEVGVVEDPDGGRYAVAVFLRLPTPAAIAPDADRAIGRLAAAAVHDLRRRGA